MYTYLYMYISSRLKEYVSFAKEPYERDYILQKRPIIFRSLLIEANPYLSIVHESIVGVPIVISVLQPNVQILMIGRL